jgi:hypothetical protein
LPNIEDVKNEADTIRRMLLEQYGGKERLHKMTIDGKDNTGTQYGIYLNTKGKERSKDQIVDYFMYGKIVGLRT